MTARPFCRIRSQIARQREQLQRHLERDVLGRHAFEQRRVFRLLFVFGRSALHVRSKAAASDKPACRSRGSAQRLLAFGSAWSSISSAASTFSSSGAILVAQCRAAFALLQERTVAAHAHVDRLATFGLSEKNPPDVAGVDLFRPCSRNCLRPTCHCRNRSPADSRYAPLAAADGVEVVFHLGGETGNRPGSADASDNNCEPRRTRPKSAQTRCLS